MKFFLLINVKMPSIVGILKFMNMILTGFNDLSMEISMNQNQNSLLVMRQIDYFHKGL